MSHALEQRIRVWTPPAVVGLVVGAICCGAVLQQVVPLTSRSAVAVTAPEVRSTVPAAFRRFEVPVALVPPSAASSIITTSSDLRWTYPNGDFIEVRPALQGDLLAPTRGTTITDRGSRAVAGVTAHLATILPRRAAESGQIRVAVLRFGDRELLVTARTSAFDPDLRVLGDFEVVLASLRVLDR